MTMKAALLDAPGGAFRLVDLPRPAPGAGEVLVRIRASGVNPLDAKIRAGAAPHARQPLPAILGMDMAGVVEAVGEGVDAFRAGDEVYGMTGGVGGLQGSLAEYAAVDATLLARKPRNLSMRDAAALPLVFITAWEGLVDRAAVRAGQQVLVQGGAGGVGHVAVQIARSFGAEVFATGRSGDGDYLRGLGAVPIDFEASEVADYVLRYTGGRGFDLVYDTGGGHVLDASFAAVRRFGHVVSCLGWGTHALAPLSFKAATYSGVFSLHPLLTGEGRARHGAILSEATRLVEAGQLVPRVDPREFGLADAGVAHEALTASSKGKIVVTAS
ncbi:MAG: quinone oxidoreductase [Sphingopyxis sp.]|nr:quinone oxidoreductase [Sphingopyxis sp.]